MDDEVAINDLVAELDGEGATEAQEAQLALESYGPAVLAPLLRAAPHFGPFGQLCAIELFGHIGDPRAGAVLTPMLGSEHVTVREWAARALGELGVGEAIPELQAAYAAVRRRGTPLDWVEPETIRSALTQLGAREEVVPPRVADLARDEGDVGRCWALEDVPEVISHLADAGQLVLYFQHWKRWEDSHVFQDVPGWELDWSLPWPRLVETSRRHALRGARAAGTPRNTVATVSWMDESDR